MADTDFARASAITRDEAGLRWQVPDGWQQGKGAFGGLVLGALLRAIEQAEPDPTRSVRALTGDLCGPVLPGPAELVVDVLRRGSNLSNFDVRLLQGGEVQARASAVLSAPKVAATLRRPPRAPETPAWDALPEVPIGPPRGPVYAPHFEYRAAVDFDAGDGSETVGRLRLRRPPATMDAATLIAMLDAWWPAIFSQGPRPMATVSFTAEILTAPASLAPDVPLLYRGRAAGMHDGFYVEFRELWHQQTLVAMNQQTFAILR